jgi:addiction module HigA family antidote
MSRRKLKPVSPGEMLREEFLRPLELSANQVARALGVPANRITGILNNTRGITADSALRLARYFDTTPEFWMNLQSRYDLEMAKDRLAEKVKQQVRPLHRAAA